MPLIIIDISLLIIIYIIRNEPLLDAMWNCKQ